MKRVVLVPNLTRIPKGAIAGGENSHTKVADYDDTTRYSFSVTNTGRPAGGTTPHWWYEGTVPAGRIVRVRVGFWGSTSGAIPTIEIQMPGSQGFVEKVSPTPAQIAPNTYTGSSTKPKGFWGEWAYTKWGTNRPWTTDDLKAFMWKAWSKKYAYDQRKGRWLSSASPSVHIHRVFLDVEYADENTGRPIGLIPNRKAPTANPRPYLGATVLPHPDGINQAVEFQISQSATDFTNAISRRSIAVRKGFAQGFFGSSGGQPGIPDVLSQGVWYIRARYLADNGFPISNWSPVEPFNVAHSPATLNHSPTRNETVIHSAQTQFRWRFQDPWTQDSMRLWQIQIQNASSGDTVVDTGIKPASDATLVRTIPPKTGNSRTYTAPAEIDYMASVAIPVEHKGAPLRWRVAVWDQENKVSYWSGWQSFTATTAPQVSIREPFDEPDTGKPRIVFDFIATDEVSKMKHAIVRVFDQGTGKEVYSAFINVGIDMPTNVIAYAAIPGAAQTMEKFTLMRTPGESYVIYPRRSFMTNGRRYRLAVEATSTLGLKGSASKRLHALYEHPTPVGYDVLFEEAEATGRVRVDWTRAIPDVDFMKWRLWRKSSSSPDWELIFDTTNMAVRTYDDFMFRPGQEYMYTLTQQVQRDEAILESPLGYRGLRGDMRINFATNPGMEFTTDDWTADGDLLVRVTAPKNVNNRGENMPDEALRWTAKAGDATATHEFIVQTEESELYASIRAYSPSAYRVFRLGLTFLTNTRTPIGAEVLGDPVTQDPGQWAFPTVDPTTIPSNTVFVQAKLHVYSDETLAGLSSDTTVYATSLLVTHSIEGEFADYDYFDGDTLGASWTGTRGDSSSVLFNEVVPEQDSRVVAPSHFYLIDNSRPAEASGVGLYVTSHSFHSETEKDVKHVRGRGRHVDYGDEIGMTGSLAIQLRGVDGGPALTKDMLIDMSHGVEDLWLRTPSGELMQVSISDPQFEELAGTGTDQMFDVSFEYFEVR